MTKNELTTGEQAYRLLSYLYCSPAEDFFEPEFLAPLRVALADPGLLHLHREREEMQASLARPEEMVNLAVEYVRLFRGPVQALVYPYESMHVDGEVMGSSTEDVLRCYGEAGLELSETLVDLPDHISVELEFVGHLYARENESRKSDDLAGAARLCTARQSFLRNHLGRWVPRLADRIQEQTTSPFYRGLAVITRELVARDASGEATGT